MTLVDLSPAMFEVSRAINPECEHLQGDMRSVRLGRVFDAVFIHDAVMYMTTEADLRAAMATAFAHCKPGGVALFAPDYVRETFRPVTDCGGHDSEGRSLRYLEWSYDPDPSDSSYTVDFVYLLREGDKPPHAVQDRHIYGLFPRADWLRLLAEVGFEAQAVPIELGETNFESYQAFVGVRPR